MRKIFSTIILFSIILIAYPQEQNPDWFKGYRTVIPGKRYEAGWLHKIFFGSHWRDVWVTPVRVPVIDMEKYGDGLTPLNKGGGLQTKSLRFKGNDGNEYKFRSLNKDPKLTIPKELRESVVYDVMADQMCSSIPYSAFVVHHLLDTFAIFHSNYTLVFLGDDAALKEFKDEFSNNVGIMEIVPKSELFEGSDKVINSVKLLDRLNKEFDETVDGKEFLKARLLDIFTGNWDRHKDQWKWIRFDEGNKKIYKPYPMDFDEAFDYLDGLFPFIATQNVNQLNHFGYNYPNLRFLTWSGRYIDQRFLGFLTKDEWDNVANNVYGKLTDRLIKNAVKKLPPEVYNIAKDELVDKLKSRRDQFKEASEDYYELVNSVIEIYTTDKDDYVLISPLNIVSGSEPAASSDIAISIYERKKEDINNKEPLRRKVIDPNTNFEIRIFLQDGDDKVYITKEVSSLPQIRLIGGEGKDEIINKSDETVYFYDDGKKSVTSGNVSRDNDTYKLPYEDVMKEYNAKKDILTEDKKEKLLETLENLKYDPLLMPDKFFMTSFFPVFSYNPDAGPLLGGTFNYLKYGFRMNPYLYKLQFMLAFAPQKKGIKGLVADFNSDFRGIVKKTGINLHLRKSGIEINNFYGMGNNLSYVESLSKAKYYRIENEKYSGELGITFPADNYLKFNFGLSFTHFRLEEDQNSIADDIIFTKDGNKKLNLAHIKGGVSLDKRDHLTTPFKGYYFIVSGNYSPRVFKDVYNFGRITADFRGYLGHKTNISMALRVRGEKVFGDSYPFFESAFLGGANSLRGYPSERFAGDGSLMCSAELRLKLFKYNFLLPQTIGIFGFGETGRVYLKNEDSKKWHAGYGGGLFLYLINRDITFKFTYARSEENDFLFYFSTGFGF